jgi:AraC family transcriptional regulator
MHARDGSGSDKDRSTGDPGYSRESRLLSAAAISHTVYSSELCMPAHAHEGAALSFVLSGGYTEMLERREHRRAASALIFRPAGERHAVRFGARPTRILNLELTSAHICSLADYARLPNRPEVIVGPNPVRLASRVAHEFAGADPTFPLALEGLVLALLSAVCHSPAPDRKLPPWLARTQELLHSRFAEPISLAEFASEAGVHPMHLARTFRLHFGCSVGAYVRHLRAEFAARRLAVLDVPLSEIATEAGFSDQSHLTKVFKRERGVTPAEYRRSLRARAGATCFSRTRLAGPARS